MKITIEPTDVFDGVSCRVWEGEDDQGTPVHCYISRVAVPTERCTRDVERRFADRLKETRAPSPEIRALPLRLLL
ncbi:MAG: hypothetical protein ACREU5_06895 [Burkholderiales bacterium]